MKYLTLELWEILICGMIGVLIQMLLKARDVQTLATRSNIYLAKTEKIKFSFKSYIAEDWISHIASTLVVVLYVIMVRRRAATIPDNLYEIMLLASATVGAGGAALASKVFSSVEKRLLAAVDHKTTVADKSSGTLDHPTPATPVPPMNVDRTGS